MLGANKYIYMYGGHASFNLGSQKLKENKVMLNKNKVGGNVTK
jgi:hypothetical protein